MKFTRKEEQSLRSYCEYENISYFSADELKNILQVLNINNTITNLIRNGIIDPVYKGKVYRLAGSSGTIEELLPRIFDKDEPFYFTGIFVYNAYRFIDQLPSKYQVANRKIKKDIKLDGFNIIFRKLKQDYFYGINKKTFMLYKERALIDFCMSYGYSRFAEILNRAKGSIDFSKLIEFACMYPVNKVARRVLYGINTIQAFDDNIIALVNRRSLITLEENDRRRGKIDKRFNIIINQ